MERIPAAPPIFKRLIWIAYAANAAIIIYGLATLSAPLVFIGAVGEVVFWVLGKMGAG